MFKNGCKVVLEFLKTNAGTILGIGGSIGAVILAKKFGVPIVYGTNNGVSFGPKLDIASSIMNTITSSTMSSTETAILHMKNQANGMMFDSNKLQVAKDIASMVREGKDISDATKSYAMRALGEISDGMMFSSSKDSVSKLIMSLIKKEETEE